MRFKAFRDFNFAALAKRMEVSEAVRVFNELYKIRWQISDQYDIKFYLENNTVSRTKRKQILLKFIASFTEDVSPYTIALLFYLIQSKKFHRLGYFINVLKIYYAEDINLLLVEVVSRYHIGETSLKVYKSSLEYIYQKRVEYIFKEDPAMIGGFRLRWYNGEIDLSVRRKLDSIKEAILQGKV